MPITPNQIRSFSTSEIESIILKLKPKANLTLVRNVASQIAKLAPKYDVDTSLRMAAFLGQVAHETGFRTFREDASGKAYEGNIKSLGNTQKGDGPKFKGRGLIQLTGRANYTYVSKQLFGDLRLLTNPDLLLDWEYGTASAFIFWNSKKYNGVSINTYADKGDTLTVSRLVNGFVKVPNGYNERVSFTKKALALLSSSPSLAPIVGFGGVFAIIRNFFTGK